MRRVLVASGLWAVVMTLLGIDRYVTYHAGADLGLFTQTLASAFAPVGTFANTLERGNHFTYHFSPILYAFAPLVIAARDGWPLIVVQAIAGALVAPPLYRIARRRVDERTAFLVALCALFYPPLVGVTFTDFHEAGLLPAATLWMLDALDARAFRRAFVFACVCLCTRDDQGLILGFLGIAAAVYFGRAGERRGIVWAGAAVAASAVVFVGYFAVVRPLAGGTDGWHPLHFYNWGASAGAPLDVRGRATYLLEAFAPLVFVPFAVPALVLALPGFAEVLGSHESLTYTMGQHYPGVWVGFVLFAFALGVGRQARKSPRIAARVVATSLTISILWLAVASPTHWGHFLRLRNANDAALDRVVDVLKNHPQNGTSLDRVLALHGIADAGPVIGTYDELYAHLGTVPCAQIGIVTTTPGCASIVDTSSPAVPYPTRVAPLAVFNDRYSSASFTDVYAPKLMHLYEAHLYARLCADAGVYVSAQPILDAAGNAVPPAATCL